MNGPEHYAEAELLLEATEEVLVGDPRRADMVALAQVHATLSLAAAAGGAS